MQSKPIEREYRHIPFAWSDSTTSKEGLWSASQTVLLDSSTGFHKWSRHLREVRLVAEQLKAAGRRKATKSSLPIER